MTDAEKFSAITKKLEEGGWLAKTEDHKIEGIAEFKDHAITSSKHPLSIITGATNYPFNKINAQDWNALIHHVLVLEQRIEALEK